MPKTKISVFEELCAATGVRPSGTKKEQHFYHKLMSAVNDLSDKNWDKLSPDAQAWCNTCSDEFQAGRELSRCPGFVELKVVEENKATKKRPARKQFAPKDEEESESEEEEEEEDEQDGDNESEEEEDDDYDDSDEEEEEEEEEQDEKPKKRRMSTGNGRKKGKKKQEDDDEAEAPVVKKKRGRPPGSKNTTSNGKKGRPRKPNKSLQVAAKMILENRNIPRQEVIDAVTENGGAMKPSSVSAMFYSLHNTFEALEAIGVDLTIK